MADSNDEVLGLFASATVDLVISDLRRQNDPDAGLISWKLLRSRNYDVSEIFDVGNRHSEVIDQAVELGATDVISQPADLHEAVQVALAGNKAGTV